MTLSPNAKTMLRMWLKTIVFALICAVIWGSYIGIERGFNIYLVNRLFATMAIFLIICSLSLASLAYFTKRFSKLLGYRMYLGVGGFFFGLFHGLLSLSFYILIEAEQPAYNFEQQWNVFGVLIPNQIAFLLGLSGLIIFAFMAIISMRRFILKLGGLLWRELLRKLGFIALTIILIHFFIKDFNKWVEPASWGHGLPPSNLYLFILGLFVLLLRLALAISLSRKKA
jgi:hypothetical protein